MQPVSFPALPLSVRLMTAASMLLSWVLFELAVIEPLGLNRYMPFYRVEGFCPYDAAAVLLIIVFWIQAHRR